MVLSAFGMAQAAILVGPLHRIIRVIHLMGLMRSGRLTRSRSTSSRRDDDEDPDASRRRSGSPVWTDAADSAPTPDRPPFTDASPAQVRAALLPEDAAEFDRQWQDVMAHATRELDLSEVHRTLNRWRRVAWVTTATGPERYRAVLASADQRLRTGERHPEAIPWNQLKAELGPPE